ncbi:hypothetical protein AVEN_260018-1 [Araneus ventricosus]|uniref:Uncharacterized protein n=1 Tax=Araneus ventricosus TaxID=182803 RepID=A0A4Y2MBK8_ARAVE|nr:hypothetical protein AVEN_260018-1 [Araneus ventricosus]
MPKSLDISVDHRHCINEDTEDRVKYEKLSKRYTSSKLSVHYLYIKFETTVSIESQRWRRRKPKTSAREDSMLVRLAQKKNDKSSRENVKDLKMNTPPLIDRLRMKNSWLVICIQRKRLYMSEQNMASTCPFHKSILRRIHNSGTVFYGHTKANMNFLDQ